MKHWSNEDIVNWHKQTFQDCSLNSQKKKFLEEYREFLENKDITELADMYIVNMVLVRRFNFTTFSEALFFEMASFPDIHPIVDKKMNINANRTWIYQDGVYHHEEVK